MRICIGYKHQGTVTDVPPLLPEQLAQCEAVYEELPGWQQSSVGATRYEDLPAAAQSYLQRLQQLVGVPIDIISTGPDREQTIVQKHPFSS